MSEFEEDTLLNSENEALILPTGASKEAYRHNIF